MKSKLFLLFLIIAAPFGYYFYVNGVAHQAYDDSTIHFSVMESTLEVGGKARVIQARVIDGYRFEIQLDNKRWITAHLATAVKDEAIPVVETILRSQAVSPYVVFRKDCGSFWIVDFHLTKDEKSVNMLSMLREKSLLID